MAKSELGYSYMKLYVLDVLTYGMPYYIIPSNGHPDFSHPLLGYSFISCTQQCWDNI